MDGTTIALAAVLIMVAAMLYASVGHAGASGYLAAMALVGVAPTVMKPTALVLNILVAAIATTKYYRAKCFSWRILWPFTVTSIPFAFMGGALTLPSAVYKPLVGAVLLLSAAWLAYTSSRTFTPPAVKPVPLWAALLAGAVLGLLSGLTGVGGGIFLSPLLLAMNWAETRVTSGVAAAFILVNSIAGLLGHLIGLVALPLAIAAWAPAAVIGGWIGAEYGSRRISTKNLRRLLAVVLAISGLKMILA